MWSYLMTLDDRYMRAAREIGEGLTEDEVLQLALALQDTVRDFFEYRQSDHSDAD